MAQEKKRDWFFSVRISLFFLSFFSGIYANRIYLSQRILQSHLIEIQPYYYTVFCRLILYI